MKILKLIPILLLAVFASCKKDTDTPVQNAITTADLLDQYIVVALNTSPKLRILYFNKEGNEVKGTLDNVSGRRVQPVSVKDNAFTFDTDGDGKKVYTFKLTRNDAGKLTLGSSTFKNQDDPGVTMEALLSSVADAQDFNGKTFTEKVSGDPDYYLKFLTSDTWSIIDYKNANGATYQGNFYQIARGAWKGTNNGSNYMGVSLPKTRSEPAQLMVEKAGLPGVLYFITN